MRRRPAPAAVVVLAVLLVPAVAHAQALRVLRSESTTVRSYDGRTMPAELLHLTVPQRRTQSGGGPTLTLAALRFATTAEKPGDPIVFLMGGPGIPGSAMARVPPYFTLFQRLREIGDVIIVDQRGIGGSEPVLVCASDSTLPTDAFVNTVHLVSALRAQVAACAQRWSGQGYDPTAFNTLESADDIDDLRQALGASKIDLLAFSYGTRLALALVQRHEQYVGRIVLQGINGPGLVVKRPAPVARKLERIGELLESDSAWNGPSNLVLAARTARDRLARTPAAITIDDRRSGKPVTLQVGREGFDAIASLNLDDARLPALLVSVAAGDDRLLSRFVQAAWNGLNAGTVDLMARAVNCAADRPRARWDVAARESASAPFGAPIDNAFLTDEFCRAVGHQTPPVEFPRPVRSSIPALLLTGSLDATNPVENQRDVARSLTNGVPIEVEHAPHEALPVPAVQDAVVDFFRGVDVRGRRLSAPRPRFVTLTDALQDRPRPQR